MEHIKNIVAGLAFVTSALAIVAGYLWLLDRWPMQTILITASPFIGYTLLNLGRSIRLRDSSGA